MTDNMTITPTQLDEAQQRCLKRATRCGWAKRYTIRLATISRATKGAGAA
jgi:hypothetical protein